MKGDYLMKRNIFIAILLLLVLLGCVYVSKNKGDGIYNSGTYQATASGYAGDIIVEVEFDQASILGILIVEQHETPGLGDAAAESMAELIKEQQTVNVDAVTSATITSEAIKTDVKDCIQQAKRKE